MFIASIAATILMAVASVNAKRSMRLPQTHKGAQSSFRGHQQTYVAKRITLQDLYVGAIFKKPLSTGRVADSSNPNLSPQPAGPARNDDDKFPIPKPSTASAQFKDKPSSSILTSPSPVATESTTAFPTAATYDPNPTEAPTVPAEESKASTNVVAATAVPIVVVVFLLAMFLLYRYRGKIGLFFMGLKWRSEKADAERPLYLVRDPSTEFVPAIPSPLRNSVSQKRQLIQIPALGSKRPLDR
jgi:hypothetical protein